MEYALGLIALVLALLGLHYARRQWQLLRRLPTQRDELSAADYRYLRNQAWRRLCGCALLWAMAGLLVANIATDLERRVDEARAQRAAQPADAPPDEAVRALVRTYAAFWGTFLSLLMALVLLTAWDVWAIRRYALRHLRQINADRRAMIEHELAVLRSQRNGQGRPPSHPEA
jgi:uncharacterized membrane protein